MDAVAAHGTSCGLEAHQLNVHRARVAPGAVFHPVQSGYLPFIAVPGPKGHNPIDFDLPYNMHYVKMLVEPGQSYTFKVKGGAAAATWSDEYEFRAPADSHGEGAVTRIAT